MSDELPKCEVCGIPAACVLRDLLCRVNLEKLVYDYETNGPAHFFCDQHKRKPQITDVGVSLNELLGLKLFQYPTISQSPEQEGAKP